jgi:hypothetical protein
MPVKVRCQSCEKVFAAPDVARGKLVKCPGCAEKVKVPAGDGAKSGGTTNPAGKKPAPAKAKKDEHHDDHEHALKNLDLDSAEDENTRVCPKCGQEIYDEDVNDCPACGLNFETGLTKEKQKGIDPKLFFRVAFKDSKKFMIENTSLAIRTGLYTLVYSVLNFGCTFMVVWCVNSPPRMFWNLLQFVTSMVPYGWLWFLNGEIIKATMEKRATMPRVNFDMFTCVALGIKFSLWQFAMGLQLFFLLIPMGIFLVMGLWIPALCVLLLYELALVLMLPQVMVHMTMPVTIRGWLMHIQLQAWAKSFGACVYWAAITFVVMLPSLIPVGVAFGIGYRGFGEFVGTMAHNYIANRKLGYDLAVVQAKRNNPKKGEIIEDVKEDDPKYQLNPLPWKKLIIPGIGIVLSQVTFGFGAVFSMRVNGLLGLYYKKHLKLHTMARDVVWMANDPTAPLRRSGKLILQGGIASLVAFPLMFGLAWLLGESGAEFKLFGIGALILGVLMLAIGGSIMTMANVRRDKIIKQMTKEARK